MRSFLIPGFRSEWRQTGWKLPLIRRLCKRELWAIDNRCMISYHERWQRTHVESTEPAQREIEEEGSRNVSPRWSPIIRQREYQREQRSLSTPETPQCSPERHYESRHIFTTIPLSCQMRWGLRNNWKKCLRGGVGIGNSAGKEEWLTRATHSSHKRSSSPGLDHLLGNFLVPLIVSAAEGLWTLGENNREAQRSEISGNTANNCTLKCSQTVHAKIQVSFWSLEHSFPSLN